MKSPGSLLQKQGDSFFVQFWTGKGHLLLSTSLCMILVIRCSSLSMDDQERKNKTMADFTLNLVTASCSLALDLNASQASSSLCALKAATNSTN